MLESGITITLVGSAKTQVFGSEGCEQIIEDINLVCNAFGAKFDFDINATIKERPLRDSDPKFVSCAQSHEPLDDDNLLGLYHPTDSSIEVFADNCSKVAAHIGQPPSLIARKVLFHEIGHLVSHVGLFIGKRSSCGEEAVFNWRDFVESASELKEYFAQVAAYLTILDLKDANLETAMLELSKHQSVKYRSWETHRALVQAGVQREAVKIAFQNQVLTLLQSVPERRQVISPVDMLSRDTDG